MGNSSLSSLHATLLLQRLPELGAATYWRLLDHCESPQQVFARAPQTLAHLFKPATCEALSEYHRDPVNSPLALQLAEDLAWLDSHPDVHLLERSHPDYPPLLAETRRPPPLLYVWGSPAALSLPQLAIVGSRNPTAGGRDNARTFARHLAANGFAITSGLALGVDGAAHQGALEAEGKTFAIMGTGIDRVYPSRHRALAEKILAGGGALISEFPLGTRSHAANFPQRNRIISALSMGTLVVEAAVKSGSLITARYALQQNREVFAIPGSIHNPLARGCHSLIREGATLVETAQDIVEQLGGMLAYQRELSLDGADADAVANLADVTPAEQVLLASMGFDPVDVETLIERTQLDAGVVLAQLMGLELKGVIVERAGVYQRVV